MMIKITVTVIVCIHFIAPKSSEARYYKKYARNGFRRPIYDKSESDNIGIKNTGTLDISLGGGGVRHKKWKPQGSFYNYYDDYDDEDYRGKNGYNDYDDYSYGDDYYGNYADYEQPLKGRPGKGSNSYKGPFKGKGTKQENYGNPVASTRPSKKRPEKESLVTDDTYDNYDGKPIVDDGDNNYEIDDYTDQERPPKGKLVKPAELNDNPMVNEGGNGDESSYIDNGKPQNDYPEAPIKPTQNNQQDGQNREDTDAPFRNKTKKPQKGENENKKKFQKGSIKDNNDLTGKDEALLKGNRWKQNMQLQLGQKKGSQTSAESINTIRQKMEAAQKKNNMYKFNKGTNKSESKKGMSKKSEKKMQKMKQYSNLHGSSSKTKINHFAVKKKQSRTKVKVNDRVVYSKYPPLKKTRKLRRKQRYFYY